MRYQLLSVFFAVAAVPIGCFATLPAPRWDNMRVKHAWEAVPENWESLGIPSAGTTISLRSALKPRREKALVRALYEVRSPGHSKDEQLVIPHPHTLELVESWLKYHGVPSPASLTHGGNWLTLTGVPYPKLTLLGASYQLYRHAETKEVTIRTVGYSLPAALHGPWLQRRTSPPRACRGRHRESALAGQQGQVKATSGDLVTALLGRDDYGATPPFLRWLYNFATYVPAATDRNVLGISGFAQEYPNPVDLMAFINHFHGSQTGATYTVVQVDSGEGDVQYTSGMAYPTPIVYYSIGNGLEGEDDPYLSWLDYIFNLDSDETDIPQTISSSYANYETEFPLDHARTLCDLFMQLGARGVSVLIASGDYGVGEGDCMTDGNVRFRPTFPASCPWVTGVGGTLGYPETAAGLGGGGFSEYFERPDYQDDAVTPFFEILGNQYHGLYKCSYDIAIMLGGEYYEALDGTSCSTPSIVAGIISLLNDYRISQGRHPLGFLNPWLYGIARRLGSPDFERLQHIANLLP
ncbi:subtilisin-like protein [Lactarius hengduanensis]|nr:subtilisin-like protein [Lactarius hengduanensis]